MSAEIFPLNPYVIGVPLSGDAGFYGRRDIFLFIENSLAAEQQNVVVLFGQRRIGKTSLLHQITRYLTEKDQVVAVHFDLQGREQHSLGKVLLDLAEEIAETLGMGRLPAKKFDEAGNYFRTKFLSSAYKKLGDRRLLLLFDEFDVLSDELSTVQAASETLFPYLNDLIMRQPQIAFIFVIGRRIEELSSNFQSVFKQAAFRRIGLLGRESAYAVITEPVKDVLTYEDGAAEAILDLTTGHPYFTQLLCYELYDEMKARGQRVVSQADVQGVIDRATETGYGALNWFWEGLPRAERFIMSAVAHVTDETTGLASTDDIVEILEKHKIRMTGHELRDAPERLVEWEMLRREGEDSYRFVVELVRRWILKSHPLDSARRDIDLISKRASRLYENARDAHEEGDLAYARDEYLRALDANPNHSGAQLGLAQVLFELSETEAAIEEFEKAYAYDEVSARDGLVRARQRLGQQLEESGREDEALFQYEQAFKEAPTNERTRRRLATIWRVRGDAALAGPGLQTSRKFYQKALFYENDGAAAEAIKSNLGQYTQVDGVKADQDYDDVITAIELMHGLELLDHEEADRRLVAIWLKRGQTRLSDQDVARACKAYREVVSRKPDEATTRAIRESLIAYIEAAEAQQHMTDAIQVAEQLRVLLPTDDVANAFEIGFWTRRGDELAAADGMLTEAIKAYQRVLELSLEDRVVSEKLDSISANWQRILEADALFDVAFAAHQNKDWSTAEAHWLKILKLDVLDHKGQNIAAFLAEAHDILTRHPSMTLELSANPPEIIAGEKVTWKVHLHNDGTDHLGQVTVRRGAGNIEKPFELTPGESKEIKIPVTYRKAQKVGVKVSATATDSKGEQITAEAKSTVVVRPAPVKKQVTEKPAKQPVLQPGLSVHISPVPKVAELVPSKKTRVTWNIIVTNTGNVPLQQVTVIRGTKTRLGFPFGLKPDESQKVTCTQKYGTVGKKGIRLTVTATSGAGLRIVEKAYASIEVTSKLLEGLPKSLPTLLRKAASRSENFYVFPKIPASVLKEHRKDLSLPKSEKVLALVDPDWPIFGSADALLFGRKGIYYPDGHLPYAEFHKRHFRDLRGHKVSLANGDVLSTKGYGFYDSSEAIAGLLDDIRALF